MAKFDALNQEGLVYLCTEISPRATPDKIRFVGALASKGVPLLITGLILS